MYGLVNQAIEALVTKRFGVERWGKIKAAAAVEEEFFVANEPYPDELTYRLVGAAAAETGLSADALLEQFGMHWVRETAPRSYGAMLNSAGASLPEFMDNLDRLHSRVQLIFPQLRPPRFAIRHERDGLMIIEYHSNRDGLSAFVVGLLKGLAERFVSQIAIQHTRKKAEGHPHDEFRVEYGPPGSAA